MVKRFYALVLSICLIGIMVACNGQNQNEKQKVSTKAPPKVVKIAFFPNITHSQALVGKAEGTFNKALGDNIKVDWKKFNAGPEEIEALFAGEVDIGYIGPGPAINGYVKSGGDLKIIAGATDAGAILVSRKDLPIRNIKELSGKKIAVPQFGNTQDLSLRTILRENSLEITTKGGTVEIVQANNPDIKTLMDKKQIDAAIVPEPWGSRLIKEVGANVVLDYNQIMNNGKYTTAVVIARTEFLKNNAEIVEKFIKAHVQLTDYINKNTEKARGIINSQIKELTGKPISNDILSSAFNRLVVTNDPEINSVKEFIKLSKDAGFLKKQPSATELFNLEILNKILREDGKAEIK